MTRNERNRYEVLFRVRQFGAAHRELFPESSKGGHAFAQVARAAAQIEAHATIKPLAAKDGRHEKTAARAAVKQAMRVVARTAKGVEGWAAKSGSKLVMPGRTSDTALVAAARGFIREAEPQEAEFVALGLPATFLTTLREATNRLERAMGGRVDGRGTVARAQAGITRGLAEGAKALRTLDIVVTNTLENDPVLFAEWIRQRRLVGGKTASRTTKPEATPASTTDTAAAMAPQGFTALAGPIDVTRRAS